MPLFSYKAFSTDGKKIAGVIDADSIFLAKEKLRKDKLLITDLIEMKTRSKELFLKGPMLLAFTRELSQLLQAGLPLYESLLTVEEKYRKHKCHPLFLDLCDQLKSGQHLSSALARYPTTFHEVYLSMVKAAEQSGGLADVFMQLTELITKQQKLKKQLVSSLSYPAFLGAFCLLVIFALFFFVIPSMQELFEGKNLHSLTAAVLGLSRWLKTNALILGVFVSSLVGAIIYSLKQKEIRAKATKALYSFPFVKTILVQSALIRFCRAMFMLLSGGVPLIEALSLSRKTMNSALLEEVIAEAEKKLVEGKKLSFLLSSSPYIPALIPRMLAIAEETGKMAFAMKSIGDIYEEELDRNLQQLTTFLQPAVLLFLGAVVGIVVLSILLPLTDVSSFLSS